MLGQYHQFVHAKSRQSCLTLCHPRDCSPPGFSVYGILQARILEWVAMSSSKGSSQPWGGTQLTNSVDMDLNKLWEIVKDNEAWHSEICGYAKSQTQLSDCKTITWPNLTRNIGNNSLKLCGPIALELKEGPTVDSLQSKPVALFIGKVGVQYHLTREQPTAPRNCRAKLVASAENSVHTQAESGSENNELYNPCVLVCCPARVGKLIHSPTYYKIYYLVLTKELMHRRFHSATSFGQETKPEVLSQCCTPSHLHPQRRNMCLAPEQTIIAGSSCLKTLPADTPRNPN